MTDIKDDVEKKGWWGRLKQGLVKSSDKLNDGFKTLFHKKKLDLQTLDELEELLILSDMGVDAAHKFTQKLAKEKLNKDITIEEVKQFLATQIEAELTPYARSLTIDRQHRPHVILVIGVNGSGKTTTIGKLGKFWQDQKFKVEFVAGDTFRAAAGEQLETWASRSGAEIVRRAEGGEPSSVIFDDVARATSRKIDLVLADTAGRLQNNTNLMEELAKVRRVADKGSGKVTEVLLVIDATTGQNGLTQAKQFSLATQVTGVVLTKLDGSAKGGIVFVIETELQIPIKLVGLGETIDDLVAFDAQEFVSALFN